MEKHIKAPLTKDVIGGLKVGDTVYLSGIIYSARDAAHKRLCELIKQGKPLPFPVENSVIYYMGPSPAKPGQVIGAAGPTTSYRMDAYAPMLIELGQTGMIGKGKRSAGVIDAMKKYGSVYFGAIGGAGALLSKCIKSAETVCYEGLGAEALRKLEVQDMPLTVIIDCFGNNLYETGPEAYLESIKREE